MGGGCSKCKSCDTWLVKCGKIVPIFSNSQNSNDLILDKKKHNIHEEAENKTLERITNPASSVIG